MPTPVVLMDRRALGEHVRSIDANCRLVQVSLPHRASRGRSRKD